ncbi:MAG TPA: glutathionylspermidine synthase family protein [Gemmataceae bacterium]|nr:glutathionylspermidine synthase family protein [Gemmataceae bacterium]
MNDALTALDLACHPAAWECTPELDAERFAALRRRLVLDHCKWDPQVGDVSTLARFAVLLPTDEWRRLARLAERLAAETDSAERELLRRPDSMRRLGLPAAVLRALAETDRPPTPAAARVIRFDFHPTPDGWRISEANSDVPGGYTEASSFASLMAKHFPGCTPVGDPAARLADALAAAAKRIALVAAPGYMEDQQVAAFVAALLRRRGCIVHLTNPRQIRWVNGVARVGAADPADAIFRFYQAEWLADLPPRLGWSCFFRGGRTPVCNPGTALLTESKRFPLTWDRLPVRLDAWRALLPPTRVPGGGGRDWLLKAALSNTGDEVILPGLAGRTRRLTAFLQSRLWRSHWVAQRRFEATPLWTPAGWMYPCLGVYTINGVASGVYGRLAPRPLIDFAAVDAVVLIRNAAGRESANGERRNL